MPKEKTPKMAVTIIIHSHICYVSMTIVIHFIYVMCFVCLFNTFLTGTRTIAFDPSFGSFTLSELVCFFGESVFFIEYLDWNGCLPC